jgi:hypothetical protein
MTMTELGSEFAQISVLVIRCPRQSINCVYLSTYRNTTTQDSRHPQSYPHDQ